MFYNKALFLYYRTLLCSLCCLSLFACAWQSNSPDFIDFTTSSDLTLKLNTNKTSYLPGEAVLTTLTLTNETLATIEVAIPDYHSMEFNIRTRDTDGRWADKASLVRPVHSEKETDLSYRELAPGASIDRCFVFTTLSFKRGEFALMPVYLYGVTSSEEVPSRTYGNPVEFRVEGEKAYRKRYQNGLITDEQAAALAREAAGGEQRPARAVMILDEMGFHQWWVNLYDAPGEPPVASYFINPYLGKVWREAVPFEESFGKHGTEEVPSVNLFDKLKRDWQQ